MSQPRLSQLLSSLSTPEQTRLRKFVASPYFNTDEKLSQLLGSLLKDPSTIHDRESLHALVLPHLPYDYHRISNLLSNLTKLVKEFLAQEYLRVYPSSVEMATLSAARERGLDDLFSAEHRRLRKQEYAGQELLGEAHQERRFRLHEEMDLWLTTRGERRYDPSLPEKITALEAFYALAMLKRACQWTNRQQILPQEVQSAALTRFLSQIDLYAEAMQHQPLFGLYQQVLQSLRTPEDAEAYWQLKAGLARYGAELPQDERPTLYQYARNYCIRRSNQGDATFLRELFSVYQEMLIEGMLFFEGQISHGDVKNLVSLGLRLGEYDWTEQFLRDIAGRIPSEHRENALVYNRAHLHYAQGKYRAALQLLAHVEFEDVFYHLGARTLLLKMYYEQGDWLPLVDVMRAFEQWLRRNRSLPTAQRQGHLNWVRLLRQLLQLQQFPTTNDQRAKLRKNIQQTQPLSQAAWLLTQMEVTE